MRWALIARRGCLLTVYRRIAVQIPPATAPRPRTTTRSSFVASSLTGSPFSSLASPSASARPRSAPIDPPRPLATTALISTSPSSAASSSASSSSLSPANSPPIPQLPKGYDSPTQRVEQILAVLEQALADPNLYTPFASRSEIIRITEQLRSMVQHQHHLFYPMQLPTTDVSGSLALNPDNITSPHGAFLLNALQEPQAKYMRYLAMRTAWARLRPLLAPIFSLGRTLDPPWEDPILDLDLRPGGRPHHPFVPPERFTPDQLRAQDTLNDHLAELFLMLWTRTTTTPTIFAPVLAHVRALLGHPVPPTSWVSVVALALEMRQPNLPAAVARTFNSKKRLQVISDDAAHLPPEVVVYINAAARYGQRSVQRFQKSNLLEGAKVFAARPLAHLPTQTQLPPHRVTTTLHQALPEDTLTLEDVFLNACMMAHGIGQADIVVLPRSSPNQPVQPIEGYALLELVLFEYAMRQEVPATYLLRTWLASCLFSRTWYSWRADTAMDAIIKPLLQRHCSKRSPFPFSSSQQAALSREETETEVGMDEPDSGSGSDRAVPPTWARILSLIHMMMDTNESSISRASWHAQLPRAPRRTLFTPHQLDVLRRAQGDFDPGRKDWLEERRRARTSRRYTAPNYWLYPFIPSEGESDLVGEQHSCGRGHFNTPSPLMPVMQETYDEPTRFLRRQILVERNEEAGLQTIAAMQSQGVTLQSSHIAPFVELRLRQGRVLEAVELLDSAVDTYDLVPSTALLARIISAATKMDMSNAQEQEAIRDMFNRLFSRTEDSEEQAPRQADEAEQLSALGANLLASAHLPRRLAPSEIQPALVPVSKAMRLHDPEGMPDVLRAMPSHEFLRWPQLVLTILTHLHRRKMYLATQQLLAAALDAGVVVDTTLQAKAFMMDVQVRKYVTSLRSALGQTGPVGPEDTNVGPDEDHGGWQHVSLGRNELPRNQVRTELNLALRAQTLAERNRVRIQLQMRGAPTIALDALSSSDSKFASPPAALDSDQRTTTREASQDLHLLCLTRRAFMLRILRRFTDGYYAVIARTIRSSTGVPSDSPLSPSRHTQSMSH